VIFKFKTLNSFAPPGCRTESAHRRAILKRRRAFPNNDVFGDKRYSCVGAQIIFQIHACTNVDAWCDDGNVDDVAPAC